MRPRREREEAGNAPAPNSSENNLFLLYCPFSSILSQPPSVCLPPSPNWIWPLSGCP